jgi:hypothetical protein
MRGSVEAISCRHPQLKFGKKHAIARPVHGATCLAAAYGEIEAAQAC